MTTPRLAAPTAVTINLWTNRGLESLWLLMALLVPLAFLDRGYALSEAVIAYVEVPKIALLRVLTALMASLWLIEWATKGQLPTRSGTTWEWPHFRPALWRPKLTGWLKESPGNWLVLAAWFFLATTLLSTAFSGSLSTSVWGEIPGQDGYPAYTIVAYLVAFGTIATHLKTRPQLWRLLGAVVIMGVLVAAYGVFQHYRVDFFDLSEPTGGRVTSFMGNTIFAAAVMSMTIPVSLTLAVVTLRDPVWSGESLRSKLGGISGEVGLTVAWGLVLAVQLMGIAFTLSRGPWVGTLAAMAIFIGLVLVFLGWRVFWRAALVLGLASAFVLAFLQFKGSIAIMGQTAWFGVVIALLATVGVAVLLANWKYLGRAAFAVLLVVALAAAVVLGPSFLGRGGSVLGTGAEQPISGEEATAGEISEVFSSIQSRVLGGSSGGRGTHWRVSWELIRDHPWFGFDGLSVPWLRPLVGYGPDLFRYTYLLRSPGEGPQLFPLEPDHAHNFFIHQTVEQGFLGLLSAVGIFLAVFAASAYQLLPRGLGLSNIHKMVLIGISATIAGRFLEMMVGVARVSDLTILWVLLAVFAALPVVMKSQGEDVVRAQPEPQPPRSRRRNRRNAASSTARQPYDWRLFFRAALVVWLLALMGVLTWVKGVNYVRAAVAEGEGMQHVRQRDLQGTLTSFDRAIALAPDVPMYHMNRAQVFFVYQINDSLPPERGCSDQSDLPYRVCLAAESFQSNLNGVSQRPFYYRSRLALANSAFDLKLNEEAVRFFEDSSSLVPASWQIKNEVADAYLEAKQPEEALKILEESIAITEGTDLSADGLSLMGRAYRDLGDPDEGARLLELALSLDSRAPWAEEGVEILIDYYSSLGSEASLDRLNESIQSDPEDPIAYYLRGLLFAQTGRVAEAHQDFSRSMNLAFSPPQIFSWRGRMAQLLGEDSRARRDLKAAVRNDPLNAEHYAYLGDIYRSEKTYFQAVQNLEQAIRLDPQLSLAYNFRGLLHHDMGLYQKAIDDFQQAISLDSELIEAADGLAESLRQLELFAQTGLATQVFENFKQSYSSAFSEPEQFAWRGRMAQLLGRDEGVLGPLEHAIRLDPQNARYHAYLGDAHRSKGMMPEAREDLEQAILLDPQLSLAYHFRGLLNHDLGLYKEAVQDFDQAISLDPDLAGAHDGRAESLLQLGQNE